jgi:hypothetical protein
VGLFRHGELRKKRGVLTAKNLDCFDRVPLSTEEDPEMLLAVDDNVVRLNAQRAPLWAIRYTPEGVLIGQEALTHDQHPAAIALLKAAMMRIGYEPCVETVGSRLRAALQPIFERASRSARHA